MIDAQDLVRLSREGRDIFVYGTDVQVGAVCFGDGFSVGGLEELWEVVNSISLSIHPNAYTQETHQDTLFFQLYVLGKREYERVLDIQRRRIQEELMT